MPQNHYFGPKGSPRKYCLYEEEPVRGKSSAAWGRTLSRISAKGSKELDVQHNALVLLSELVKRAPNRAGQDGKTLIVSAFEEALESQRRDVNRKSPESTMRQAVLLLRSVLTPTERRVAITTVKHQGYRFNWIVTTEQVGSEPSDGLLRRFNVPVPSSEFVGRDPEILQVIEDLTAGRGVNIWSCGGRGKSHLAFAIAKRLRDSHSELCADGQIYVDLLGYSSEPLDTDSAMRWILRALPGVRNRFETLAGPQLAAEAFHLLGRKRLLIVADNARNFEQVSLILSLSLPISLLVTSRGEIRAKRLDSSRELEALEREHAVAFLARISGLTNAKLLGAVAERCMFNPLALGLAARGLKRFESRPQEYLRLLDQSPFQTLEADSPSDESLRLSSIIWASYSLLPDRLQSQWLALSVFPQSFAVDAAANLWDGLVKNSSAELKSLVRDHALVVSWEIDGEDNERRYRLHDCSRDFALELLRQRPEFDVVATRHAVYYADLFLERSSLLETDAAAAKRFGDAEYSNLDAARAALSQSGMTEPTHASLYCRLYVNWYVYLNRVSPAARDVWTSPAPRLASRLMQTNDNRLLRAQINSRRGSVLAFQKRYTDARRRYQIAKALLRRMGSNTHGKNAIARQTLDEDLDRQIAWNWMDVNKHENAVPILCDLIERLGKRRSDRKRFGILLESRDALAGAYLTLKKTGPAAELLAGTFELIRTAPVPVDIWNVISAITVTGCMYVDIAVADRTRTVLADIGCSLCKLAYDICKAHERPWGLAVLSQRLGNAYLQLGQPVTAQGWLRNAESFAKEWGITASIEQAQDGLSLVKYQLQAELEANRIMNELRQFTKAQPESTS